MMKTHLFSVIGLLCAGTLSANAQVDKSKQELQLEKPQNLQIQGVTLPKRPELIRKLDLVEETEFDKDVVLLKDEMSSIDEGIKDDLEMESIDAEISRFEVPVGEEKADQLKVDTKMELIDSEKDLLRKPELVSGVDDSELGEQDKFIEPEPELVPETELERFVESIHADGISIGKSLEFVGQNDEYLLKTLSSSDKLIFHANAVTLLALSGSREAEDRIVAYIQSGKGELSAAEFNAKTSAIMSLGYLANISNGENGLEVLQKTAQAGGWKDMDLSWRANFSKEENATFQTLQRYSLIGLALSGHSIANEALSVSAKELSASESDWSVTDEELEAYRKELEEVVSMGLVNYSDRHVH